MNRTWGYARVSSKDQREDRQIAALLAFGISEKNIYLDKCSGKDFDRPQYQRMKRRMGTGDLLVILSIDRLGRNYDDIIEQWRDLTKERDVDIKVLDMPLLDTRNNSMGLLGTFVADLVLQILSYVAQTERESIRERQRQGIEIAQRNGIRFGRPPLDLPEQYEAVAQRWRESMISSRAAAKELGVSQNTFLRWTRIYP